MSNIRMGDHIRCASFPCSDIDHQGYLIPKISLNPEKIRLIVISESPPSDPKDDYYADGDASYVQNTCHAFSQAGIQADSIDDLISQGIYFTTAIKCAKTAYNITSATVTECSLILEKSSVYSQMQKTISSWEM